MFITFFFFFKACKSQSLPHFSPAHYSVPSEQFFEILVICCTGIQHCVLNVCGKKSSLQLISSDLTISLFVSI